MFVEQQVIVAEVRPRYMPMEVLGLQVKRKEICEQCIERARDVSRRLCAEDGRRADLGAAGRNTVSFKCSVLMMLHDV